MYAKDYIFRRQTKLRGGNVFTPVCQLFCSRGEGGLPNRDPPELRFPWTETSLDRNPPGQKLLGQKLPPRTETPYLLDGTPSFLR